MYGLAVLWGCQFWAILLNIKWLSNPCFIHQEINNPLIHSAEQHVTSGPNPLSQSQGPSHLGEQLW